MFFTRLIPAALIAALVVLLEACGPAVPPLAAAHASVADLATAVIGAFERRDLSALRSLALDEREFRDHVWPELPAARPERNLPLDYVWGDLHQKSDASLTRLLAARGGERLTFVGIRYLGGTTPYQSYLVHRRAELTVRDAQGAIRQTRLFGSVIEKDGRLKVFSYVVDND